ncbi:hypothetical protein LSAT2_005547 [Lamellibrachia satsuma]|nr:hypothetical protein LSAT2_005547 [Lamellibrachia satsuma]
MWIVRCKFSTTPFKLFVVFVSLMAITTTTCSASKDTLHKNGYQRCLDGCLMVFFKCIRDDCPGHKWPMTIPLKCIEKRTRCQENCQPLKLILGL